MKRQQGFTLLELLLVLAVIAVMISVTISFSRNKIRDTHVAITVQQLQLIQSAALAYYDIKQKWPNDISDLRGTGSDGQGIPLLPQSLVINPFCQSIGDTSCNYIFIAPPLPTPSNPTPRPTALLYTQLPPVAYNSPVGLAITSSINQQFADALTPSDDDWLNCQNYYGRTIPGNANTTVVLKLLPPGMESSSTSYQVLYSGLFHVGEQIPTNQNNARFQCPKGFSPHYFAWPVRVNGLQIGSTANLPVSAYSAYVDVESDNRGNPSYFARMTISSPDLTGNTTSIADPNRSDEVMVMITCSDDTLFRSTVFNLTPPEPHSAGNSTWPN